MAKVESGLLAGVVPYIRGGSGEREAVVFFGVNALFKSLEKSSDPGRYAAQVAALLPGYRFTILGYAGSGFDEIVRHMALAVPTAPDVLMGISLGGLVAVRFAAEYPERVKRLVLLVSAHRLSSAGRRMVDRQFDVLEKGDFRTLVRENARLYRRPWYNWAVRLKLWKDGGRLAAEFRDAAAILRDYRKMFGPDFQGNADYARRVACATLILGGTADQLFDRAAFAETAELISGAQLQLFEGETHMLPVEKSAAVRTAIRGFLRVPDR